MVLLCLNMNKLTGIIKNIQKSGAILLVDVDVDGHNFSAMLIESTLTPLWLQTGNTVEIVFKETEVSLAKNLSGLISMRNRLPCKVVQVQRGELFSNVCLQFYNHTIMSAITTRSVDSLQIITGDELEALIKANEISLMKKE
jgi:molybdate transport system regulatory protein